MTNQKPKRRGKNAHTIHDVARIAGVSVGTVSKAMNKTGKIAPATREKVRAAAAQLNFRPNVLARSLHTGLSGAIGLISNDSFGRFTMPIMEGLERVLSEHSVSVFMCNATDDPERERAHIDQLLAKQIDGIIVTSRRADHRPAVDLKGLGIPVIYVFADTDDADALTLLPDDAGGADMAVAHLVALGRTKIAHVTGPKTFEAVRLRCKGYAAALRTAGLAEIPVLHGKWSESWGREAAQQLIKSPTPPDAIFCGNDQIARGCADALREAGLSVPKDVALIGFDNWDVMTSACRPPLTSVDMGLSELGAEAAREMLARIKADPNTQPTGGLKRLPCKLRLRASTDPTTT